MGDSHTLYGIAKNVSSISDVKITKKILDMNNVEALADWILIVKPDIIIHLASISSSHYAFNHPIEALNSNGMLTAHLCDIIHKNKLSTKLFNASSSEMYKGHIDYLVKEDDGNMNHNHPYSIAKIMGHSIVNFYRNTYGLPFSNGVIFTTESERKSAEFLLNKLKSHAKLWKTTKESQPITVGNLDSYRNILHAADVASAIYTIIQQQNGADYLICNDFSVKVYDLVLKIYQNNGINLVNINNTLQDSETGSPVVIIDEKRAGNDVVPTNIRGECIKLKELGWIPKCEINDLLV
jgi:GDPmannose 4,6-dehydratase